jgi:tetratricopeptide (TPR) repeat protein
LYALQTMIRILSVALILLITWSCSQNSTKPAAVTFHNINSKYNAIWQADQLLENLQSEFQNERVENYANELPIIAPMDSSFGISHKLEINNLIRKASLVIDRHQNSKFVDDAYLLIAHGRYYQSDFKNAIETLKYINTLEPDKQTQRKAMTLLYQLYLMQHDIESAEKTETFILENELESWNYSLAKAFEHQVKGEINSSIQLVNQLVSEAKNRHDRSRLYFILGQMYERSNQSGLAQQAYQNSMRQKSNYELTLRANIANKALEKSVSALEKLLEDPKNEDQKSEIYIALGKIYLEEQDLTKAKSAWQKATNNNPNKGELYFQLGNLFADQIHDYARASAYFDSASTYLSNSNPNYPIAIKAKKNWNKYVALEQIVQQEDSLQKLAKLSYADLKSIYEKAQAKKSTQHDSLSKVQNKATKLVVTFTRRPPSADQQSFYFYNEQARIRGEQEFTMKWGIRTLEDYWNRKNKQNAPSVGNLVSNNSIKDSTIVSSTTSSSDSMQIWIDAIPKTDKKLIASNKKKEQALFELGKHSKTQMGMNTLAFVHLERLMNEFPYTSFEAEALYLQYLSSENRTQKNKFKTLLFDRYPDSIYRMTILKLESGTLSDSKEQQAEKAYEAAYAEFKANRFELCLNSCQTIRMQFPGSKSEDKVVFLSALCYAGLKDRNQYTKTLTQFVQLFPASPLKQEAEERLKSIPKN